MQGRNALWCALLIAVAATASANYIDEVMADSPVGYWRLGEASGVTALDSADARPGSYEGGVTLGQPGALGGDPDTAAVFDGSGRVLVPFDPALNPAQFTIEAWARVDGGAGTWRSPLTSRDHLPPPGSGQRGYLFYAGTNNQWQFWTGTGTGWHTSTGPAVQIGEWAHLVGTFDGATKSFYVNGVPVDSDPALYLQNTASNLHIGAGGDEGTEFRFLGGIDEVAIYNAVLPQERIRQHYAAGVNLQQVRVWPGADVLLLPLNEGTGTTAHDLTPHQAHGTFVGAPTWSDGKFVGGLAFSGTDGDHVRLGSFPAGSYPQLTFEAWVLLGDKQGRNELFNEQSRDSLWVNFDTRNNDATFDDALDVYLGDTTTKGYHSTYTAIPRGEWTHVAFTYSDDLDELRLYVNGLLDRVATTSGTIDFDSSVILGKRESGFPELGFQGVVDELALYSRVLSADEIWSRYTGGPPIAIPEPATLALLGCGLMALRRRPRSRRGSPSSRS